MFLCPIRFFGDANKNRHFWCKGIKMRAFEKIFQKLFVPRGRFFDEY